ncbi:MAG TPA: hypothetical protein PLB97_04635 [Accumulibacter sp.]|jgi:hypothetical protein|nr:hypothetical protein [Accumulibacter sp.]HPP46243.1 hypothetical protein [Accumulibacter sp.]
MGVSKNSYVTDQQTEIARSEFQSMENPWKQTTGTHKLAETARLSQKSLSNDYLPSIKSELQQFPEGIDLRWNRTHTPAHGRTDDDPVAA